MLISDTCSGKALKIVDLIKTALHSKSVGEEEEGTLKDVTEYPALLSAYCNYPYGNLDALISPVNIALFSTPTNLPSYWWQQDNHTSPSFHLILHMAFLPSLNTKYEGRLQSLDEEGCWECQVCGLIDHFG